MSEKKKGAGRNPINFTEDQVLAAISGSLAIVSRVAKNLNCDWTTADNYIKKYPAAVEAMKAEEQAVLDLCETKIIKAINLDDVGSAKWYLSKKGKDRGYGDEQIITHTGQIEEKKTVLIQYRADSIPENNDSGGGAESNGNADK